MRENNRNSIEKSRKKLPQFTTMNVIDGQASLVIYASLIFYSLTIDNILNIIIAVINTLGISIGLGFDFATNQLLHQIFGIAKYIFPFKTLLPLLVVVISITLFKFGVAVLKIIWDIFPFSP